MTAIFWYVAVLVKCHVIFGLVQSREELAEQFNEQLNRMREELNENINDDVEFGDLESDRPGLLVDDIRESDDTYDNNKQVILVVGHKEHTSVCSILMLVNQKSTFVHTVLGQQRVSSLESNFCLELHQ